MFILPDLKPEEIIIYLRKSRTDDPALTVSETLSKHEQMLDEYSMRTWGATVPEQNRFREVVSGETIDARPEIKKVLHLIERDKFKAILIVEPQRLSRGDLEDIGRISKILRYTRTLVITLQYSYDLTDERDRDYFERELKRGNDYLEYSKRIMLNGLRLCVENGYYVGSQPPYGYKKVSYKENKRTVHTLEIVPEEADAVRMMFEMYANDTGAATICRILNDSGIPPRKADIWRPPVIYRILDNPVYIGLVSHSRRKQEKIIVGGEMIKTRAQNRNAEFYQGRHEPIIPKDLWDKVQLSRKSRHLPHVRSHLDIQNPLAGLVRCECGRIMVKAAQLKGRNIRMHCPDQTRCHNAGCTLDILMQKISESLRAELADFPVKYSGNADESSAKVRVLEARIEALKQKQESLWEKYAEGMPKPTFDRLIRKNESELSECSRMLSEAREDADSKSAADAFETSLYATIEALSSIDAPVKETNALLKTVIRHISYSRKPRYVQHGKTVVPEPKIEIEFNF